MDRRHAIKNLGLAFGAVVATPTVLSILKSCGSEPVWNPYFFTVEEGNLVKQLADVVIPKTDTPSATEVFAHQFVDKYAAQVLEPEIQEVMQTAMASFVKLAQETAGTQEISGIKDEHLEMLLSSKLKVSKEQEREYQKELGDYIQALEDPNASETPNPPSDTALAYIFLDGFRSLTVWGYRSSRKIGEEILVYEPVPGKQQGCVDLQEATGGLAYSLNW